MWIVYSLIMFVSSILIYYTIRLSRNENIDKKVISVGLFVVPTIVFLMYAIFNPQYFNIPLHVLIVAFLASFFISYIGNIASLMGMEQASNPGYSLVIQKGYGVLTTVASIFLFGLELNIGKIFSIFIIIGSTAFIILTEANQKKAFKPNLNWIFYSFYCFLGYGTLSLLGRWVGQIEQIPTATWLLYLYIFISIWVVTDLLIWKMKTKPIINLNLKKWSIVILVGVFLAIFGTAMQNARVEAPNPGYADAINASSNAFFTIITSFLFGDELNKQKLIGIFGVTVGLISLVI